MRKVLRLFCFCCKLRANIVEQTFPHRLSPPPRKSNLERRFGEDFEVYFASKLIMLIRRSKDLNFLVFSRSRTVIRTGKCRHYRRLTGKYFKTFMVGLPTFQAESKVDKGLGWCIEAFVLIIFQGEIVFETKLFIFYLLQSWIVFKKDSAEKQVRDGNNQLLVFHSNCSIPKTLKIFIFPLIALSFNAKIFKNNHKKSPEA